MIGLFANELVKLKRSKTIKGVFITFMCFMLLAVFIDMGESAIYGFSAPFLWLSCNGASGFFLYGLIVAGMVASEFENGVIHNALGCGVKRGRYFVAKLVTVFGVSVAMYLSCMCIFTALRSMRVGFDPNGQAYADYGLKVLVFNIGAVIAILAYVALFMCVAYLLRSAALTFVAAIVLTIVDLLGGFSGPLTAAWDTLYFYLDDAVLTWKFASAFIPCVYILLFSLAGSYVLFRLRDLN